MGLDSLKTVLNTAQGFGATAVTSGHLRRCLFSFQHFNIHYGYNLILQIAVFQQFIRKVYSILWGICFILQETRTKQTYTTRLTLQEHASTVEVKFLLLIWTEIDQAGLEHGGTFQSKFSVLDSINSR